MVRNMFASTAVVLAGIAGFAAAATYEDFTLDTTVALNYAAPASVISTNFGTIDDLKTACDAVDDCLGVAYQASAGGGYLLRYDSAGAPGLAAGFSAISWRYDTPNDPTCESLLDTFAENGQCTCDEATQIQNTAYGCSSRLLASTITRRVRRNHIMPGRAYMPAF